MALRDNVYQEWGPLLTEAIAETLLDEINSLRERLGLPIIIKEQFLGKLHNNKAHLEDYDWMETE